MRALAAIAAACLILAAPAAALAACPQTSVADLEDEVMCPVCGTSLATAGDAPLAVQQRRLIDRLVNQCRSKEQIKSALAAQYGDSVLADPDRDGFGVTTWAVPLLGIVVGLGAAGFAAVRWRRRRPPRPLAASGPSPESDRVEEDMRRYKL